MPHAFKDLLILETPQFILNIAVRYVLHHYSSQDIHHCKILEDWFYERCQISKKGFVNGWRKKGCTREYKNHVWLWHLRRSWLWNTLRANDPSAGSPTETLLRLLLPLSDKVYSTLRNQNGNQKDCAPKYSPDHSIGRSDGRCVQRAGT